MPEKRRQGYEIPFGVDPTEIRQLVESRSGEHPESIQPYTTGYICYDLGMETGDVDFFRYAEHYYALAAKGGVLQGIVGLGYIYAYYRIPDKDDNDGRACAMFLGAANEGHPEAMYKFGDMLARGQGVEQDDDSAFAYYQKSYDASHDCDVCTWWASADYRLGECYENARGCEQNFIMALHFYKEAEEGFVKTTEVLRNNYYKKKLSNTRNAIKRIEQELSGGF